MKLKNFLSMNISKINVNVYVGFVDSDMHYKEINIYNVKEEDMCLAMMLYECEVQTYEIIPICADMVNMFIRVVTVDPALLLISKEDVKEASEMWDNDLYRKLINGDAEQLYEALKNIL